MSKSKLVIKQCIYYTCDERVISFHKFSQGLFFEQVGKVFAGIKRVCIYKCCKFTSCVFPFILLFTQVKWSFLYDCLIIYNFTIDAIILFQDTISFLTSDRCSVWFHLLNLAYKRTQGFNLKLDKQKFEFRWFACLFWTILEPFMKMQLRAFCT